MAKPKSFSDQLRQAILASGKTRYAISQETGIPQSRLSEFMHGRGMSLANVDLICENLRLRIVSPERRKGG